MKKGTNIIKYILTIVILGAIIFIVNKNNILKGYSASDIKEYVTSFGVLSPIVYIILFTLVPLTLFPDSILAISSGMIFGLFKGFIYTMIGALFGASLSFFITRILGKKFIDRFIKKDISKIGGIIEKRGFFIILVLRLIPLFPFDIISYGAGLSDVKYKDFLAATIIGTIPGIFVYTNVGDKSTDIGSTSFVISILLLVLLFVVSLLLKKKLSFNDREL